MTCRFKTPTYHPNIDSRGFVHVDILECRWSPVLTVPIGMHSALSLLLQSDQR
jgi:ubiquitin-protein ligase